MDAAQREEFLVRASEMLVDADVSDAKKEKIRTALEALGVDVLDFEVGARKIAKAFQSVTPASTKKALDRDLRILRGQK